VECENLNRYFQKTQTVCPPSKKLRLPDRDEYQETIAVIGLPVPVTVKERLSQYTGIENGNDTRIHVLF